MFFRVGDKVRYKDCFTTYSVVGVTLSGMGVNIKSDTNGKFYQAHRDRLELVHGVEATVEKKEEKMKLYQITHKDKTLYGHKLAVNSAGQWVMEVKGTSEVIPHSISVKFFGKDTEYHYLAPKDKYTVGQTFVYDSKLGYGPSFVVVTNVDTKSTNATKEFEPIAEVLTKPIDK